MHQRQQSAPRNFLFASHVRILFFRSWRSPLVCERSVRASLEQRLIRAPLQQSLQLQQCCERSIHVLLEQRLTPAQLQKCSGAQLQQCFGERRLQGSPSRSSRPTQRRGATPASNHRAYGHHTPLTAPVDGMAGWHSKATRCPRRWYTTMIPSYLSMPSRQMELAERARCSWGRLVGEEDACGIPSSVDDETASNASETVSKVNRGTSNLEPRIGCTRPCLYRIQHVWA